MRSGDVGVEELRMLDRGHRDRERKRGRQIEAVRSRQMWEGGALRREWRDAGRRGEGLIVITGPCCLLICVSVSSR